MKKEIIKRKYKGLGFVEALMGLTVAGLVSIVLMSISAQSIRELRKLDMQDTIAQYAISTGVHVQDLAIKEALLNPEGNRFYGLSNNSCYKFYDDGSINFDIGQPKSNVKREFFFNSQDVVGSEYFRGMCVEHFPASERRKVLISIRVGSSKVEGRATSEKDVKDLEYFVIINL